MGWFQQRAEAKRAERIAQFQQVLSTYGGSPTLFWYCGEIEEGTRMMGKVYREGKQFNRRYAIFDGNMIRLLDRDLHAIAEFPMAETTYRVVGYELNLYNGDMKYELEHVIDMLGAVTLGPTEKIPYVKLQDISSQLESMGIQPN